MNKRRSIWSTAIATVVSMAAVGMVAGPAVAASTVRLNGSTTVNANILQGKQHEIEAASGTKLEVVANGSGNGLTDLVAGRADVAMLSSPLPEVAEKIHVDASGFKAFQVGLSRVKFIVHPSNPVKSLTLAQIRDIFSGKIANWKDVGGPDAPIVVVVEHPGAGLRTTFEEKVMKGTPITSHARLVANGTQIPLIVKQLASAIGPATPKTATGGVKVVATDEIAQPLFLVTKGAPSPVATKLIEAMSKAGH